MPTRLDRVWIEEGMGFETPVFPETAGKAVLLPPAGLTLRKLDDGKTKYDPSGKYYETVVSLRNWTAEGLKSLFGFESFQFVQPEIPNLDPSQQATIMWRVSVDGGTTWLVWVDGPDQWLPAVGTYATLWNDEETVDKRIPLLPFTAVRQVRLQARMIPGANGRQRPILNQTIIYNKHKLDLYEDVARSIKRFLDGAVQVPMYYYAELATPSQTITIEPEIGLDVTILPPIEVYNTTTDPGRLVNLFQSIASSSGAAMCGKGSVITMTSSQTGNIEVRFTGVPGVYIGAEEFFEISKIPSIVVNVEREEMYLEIRGWSPETERSIARKVGRLQNARLFYMIYVTIRSQSSLNRESMQMADAVARALDKSACFPSVANGERYVVMDQIQSAAEDRVPQGLFVKAVRLKIMGGVWLEDEVTVEPNLFTLADGTIPLVQEVDLLLGAENTCNMNLPRYLRRIYREDLKILVE